MNAEALRLTIETGEVHYYSRSRKALWKKGETSGEVQKLVELRTDCDQDVVLLTVEQTGRGAACHTGRKSCFYRVLEGWRAGRHRRAAAVRPEEGLRRMSDASLARALGSDGRLHPVARGPHGAAVERRGRRTPRRADGSQRGHPRARVLQPQPGDQRDEPAGRGGAEPQARVAAVARLPRRQVRDGSRGDRGDRGHRRRAGGRDLRARSTPRSASARARSPISTRFMALANRATRSSRRRPAIGGHVTHHGAGCAGLYGLNTHRLRRSTPPTTRSTSRRCASWRTRRGRC